MLEFEAPRFKQQTFFAEINRPLTASRGVGLNRVRSSPPPIDIRKFKGVTSVLAATAGRIAHLGNGKE
ncbi:hypothetical protein EVAR_12379_1 [Eumeta japonica]|uniref:Uncharacterized protein n=1 Tax=Eumeta variegata TaxID=151549 RepID=A0A4C1TZI0_EUMVA|nr:hypothetical protein EVAR_12379_1 [Eumeta japonica]